MDIGNAHLYVHWWMIFPLIWLVYGLVRMVMRDNYERQRLRILKSYAEQGKDIPEALRRELYRPSRDC